MHNLFLTTTLFALNTLSSRALPLPPQLPNHPKPEPLGPETGCLGPLHRPSGEQHSTSDIPGNLDWRIPPGHSWIEVKVHTDTGAERVSLDACGREMRLRRTPTLSPPAPVNKILPPPGHISPPAPPNSNSNNHNHNHNPNPFISPKTPNRNPGPQSKAKAKASKRPKTGTAAFYAGLGGEVVDVVDDDDQKEAAGKPIAGGKVSEAFLSEARKRPMVHGTVREKGEARPVSE